MKQDKLRYLLLAALISAICVIGSFIKVPGFITTAALDSAPAFLSVFFLPPLYAGAVGTIGHLATALTSGMPLGPFHLLIAVEMFVIVFIFAKLHQHNFKWTKWPFLILANGILSPLPFYFLISPAFYLGALPSLFVATVINVVIVMACVPVISRVKKMMKWETSK
ncbi:ECF transporter S component [Solibacillus sp. CAU 1738]|uniref:ECF transporter S component n=1 Tax=Solibacillus sp. CAU 1738 TaxID=3140363 RepID=UPI003261C7E9